MSLNLFVHHIGTCQSRIIWRRYSRQFSNRRFISRPLMTNSAINMNVVDKDAGEAAPTSVYVLPNNQPMVVLPVKAAFSRLTSQQRLYAHYLSRASYYGGLIVLFQTSYESPNIFRLIHRMNLLAFDQYDESQLKEFGVKARLASLGRFQFECVKASKNLTEADMQAYLVYCSAIYANMGNYKGFGDTKIVPGLTSDAFGAIVEYVCDTYAGGRGKSVEADGLWSIWNGVKDAMYSLAPRHRQLGMGDAGGVTKYFSANCTQADSDMINRYFKTNNLEGYNNRVVKIVDKATAKRPRYDILTASVDERVLKEDVFEGCDVVVLTGDYSPLLRLVNRQLQECQKYAANENQRRMVEEYIKSFETGSLDAHKMGSRYWIKDKGPAVESYIGFIETYRDPVGMRGEFEGFVAVVNAEQSAKFGRLVEQAEQLLMRLPWPAAFEKDTFLRPDFTSLDVVSFAGSGVPSGINIPNYDEIRQSEGFKNVNLGNVIAASLGTDPGRRALFVSSDDHELLEKWRVAAFEVQVGLHELLGHGSGKLLIKADSETGKPANFDVDLIDPMTQKRILSSGLPLYDVGQTYDAIFTSLGSSFEECRAEAVGLLLSTYLDVIRIFNDIDEDAVVEDVMYVNWLLLCQSGLKGLEMYSPETGQWKQAHCQARFVILQVLLEAGEGLIHLEEFINQDDGKPDIKMTLDKAKLVSVGRPAMERFLLHLQVYKSTANVVDARTMFDKYSAVTNTSAATPFADWRQIVLARRQPRKMMIQANTTLTGDSPLKPTDAEVEEYTMNDVTSMLLSWVQRFPTDEFKSVLDPALEQLQAREQSHYNY